MHQYVFILLSLHWVHSNHLHFLVPLPVVCRSWNIKHSNSFLKLRHHSDTEVAKLYFWKKNVFYKEEEDIILKGIF